MSTMADNSQAWQKLAQECAQGAVYDSNERQPHSKCLDGTRAGVLQALKELVDDNERKFVWLAGESGSGKSTIAHTFADELRQQGKLAATFFFSRKHTKRSTFDHVLLTFAYQLGLQHHLAKEIIVKAIADDPAILSTEKSRTEQLDKLIIEPLNTLAYFWAARGQDGMSMILDALDEGATNGTPHIHPFVTLLARLVRNKLPIRNIIITSRPWTQIEAVMHDESLADIMRTVNVDEDNSREDVIRFLRHAFDKIYKAHRLSDYPELVSTPWPSAADFSILSERANGRFIFAATIIRQIDQDQPHLRLPPVCSMLRGSVSGASGNIDDLYSAIIDDVDSSVREKGLKYLSLIVNLAEPLALVDLNRLFADRVHPWIIPFSALVSIPPSTDSSAPVQIFHTSLRDFLQKQAQKNVDPVYIPHPTLHGLLTSSCFRMMSSLLKRDICGLQDPSLLHTEIPDFIQRRDTIPRALRYACRQWLYHLQQASPNDEVYDLLLDFLRRRVLFAIEALSVFDELATAVHQFKDARKLVEGWLEPPFAEKDEAMALLYDSWRSTLDFFDPISQSALHVYESALPCSPATSTIRLIYKHVLDKASSFTFEEGLNDDWDCVIRAIDAGDLSDLKDYTLSPDGSELAAAFEYSVNVWATATGMLIRSLPLPDLMYTGPGLAAFIAHGGSHIAFTNESRTSTSNGCFLWRLSDDRVIPLGLPLTVRDMGPPTFSYDGLKVACLFMHDDDQVSLHIYDSATCQQLSYLPLDLIRFPPDPLLHRSLSSFIEFSYDDSWLMVHIPDNHILIFDPETGRLLEEVNCPCSEETNYLTGIHFIDPNDNSTIHARAGSLDSHSPFISIQTAQSTSSSGAHPEMIFYNGELVGIKLGNQISAICRNKRNNWKSDECIGAAPKRDVQRTVFFICDLVRLAVASSPQVDVDPNHPGQEYSLVEDEPKNNVQVYTSRMKRETLIVGPQFRTVIPAWCKHWEERRILSPKSTYVAICTRSEHSCQIWNVRSGVRTGSVPIEPPNGDIGESIWYDAQFSADDAMLAVVWKGTDWKLSVYSMEAGELHSMAERVALPDQEDTYVVYVAAVTRDGVDLWVGDDPILEGMFTHLRCNIQGKTLAFVTKASYAQLYPRGNMLFKPAQSPNFKRVHVRCDDGRPALDLVEADEESDKELSDEESDTVQTGGERVNQAKYRLDESTRSGVFFDEYSWSDLCMDVDGWLRKKGHRICWLPVRYRPVSDGYRGLKLIIDGQKVTILGLADHKRITIRLLNTEIEYFDQ